MVIRHLGKITRKLKTIYNYSESKEIKNMILESNKIIKNGIGFKINSKHNHYFEIIESELVREKCNEIIELVHQTERSVIFDSKTEKYINEIIKYLEYIIIEC